MIGRSRGTRFDLAISSVRAKSKARFVTVATFDVVAIVPASANSVGAS